MTSSNATIIGPDDPPPFTLINQQGNASILLVGDHVSNVIPKALDSLGLDEVSLGQHIAYDIGTAKLIHHLSEHLDSPAVLAGYGLTQSGLLDRLAKRFDPAGTQPRETALEHAVKHLDPTYICPMHPQIAENEAGMPEFKRRMNADLEHPIEDVGRKLRSRMDWLEG